MYTTVTSACIGTATWRVALRALLAAALVAGALRADPAIASDCGWDPVCCNPCFTPCAVPWVGGCSYRSFCGSGWGFGGFGLGFGVSRYRSFGWASPGLWCGAITPCFVPAPVCGWYPYSPVLFTPTFNCYPGAFAPVYGPAGAYPFLGLGARGGTTVIQIGRGPAVNVRQFAARDASDVRASNPAARLRAARLVAAGDRHLRAAVNDRAKLQQALSAYRRAEAIAADQPDTFLRQAIVLTALERADDAGEAVKRAVAIDGRLAEAGPPAEVAERLQPDPAFGDRPLGAPSLLAERSRALLAGIFNAADAAADEGNWIAARWARRVQGDVLVVAK
jgi:tetratricopeptide (TPR) repeat protein